MAAQQIGYQRVSTLSQNTDRQLDGVKLDKVFTDKASGGNAKRPKLDAMLKHIRDGDTVHVHSIDRLARNLSDLMQLIESITGKGSSVRFHKEALTFDGGNSSMQVMQMQIMGAVAQFERSIINERAAEGRAIAKARGVRFGKPPALNDKQTAQVIKQRKAGKSVAAIALDFDVSRQSIYRILNKADEKPRRPLSDALMDIPKGGDGKDFERV